MSKFSRRMAKQEYVHTDGMTYPLTRILARSMSTVFHPNTKTLTRYSDHRNDGFVNGFRCRCRNCQTEIKKVRRSLKSNKPLAAKPSSPSSSSVVASSATKHVEKMGHSVTHEEKISQVFRDTIVEVQTLPSFRDGQTREHTRTHEFSRSSTKTLEVFHQIEFAKTYLTKAVDEFNGRLDAQLKERITRLRENSRSGSIPENTFMTWQKEARKALIPLALGETICQTMVFPDLSFGPQLRYAMMFSESIFSNKGSTTFLPFSDQRQRIRKLEPRQLFDQYVELISQCIHDPDEMLLHSEHPTPFCQRAMALSGPDLNLFEFTMALHCFPFSSLHGRSADRSFSCISLIPALVNPWFAQESRELVWDDPLVLIGRSLSGKAPVQADLPLSELCESLFLQRLSVPDLALRMSPRLAKTRLGRVPYVHRRWNGNTLPDEVLQSPAADHVWKRIRSDGDVIASFCSPFPNHAPDLVVPTGFALRLFNSTPDEIGRVIQCEMDLYSDMVRSKELILPTLVRKCIEFNIKQSPATLPETLRSVASNPITMHSSDSIDKSRVQLSGQNWIDIELVPELFSLRHSSPLTVSDALALCDENAPREKAMRSAFQSFSQGSKSKTFVRNIQRIESERFAKATLRRTKAGLPALGLRVHNTVLSRRRPEPSPQIVCPVFDAVMLWGSIDDVNDVLDPNLNQRLDDLESAMQPVQMDQGACSMDTSFVDFLIPK